VRAATFRGTFTKSAESCGLQSEHFVALRCALAVKVAPWGYVGVTLALRWRTLANFGGKSCAFGNFWELWRYFGVTLAVKVARLGTFGRKSCALGSLWGYVGVTLANFGEFCLQKLLKHLLIPYYIFKWNVVASKNVCWTGKTAYSFCAKVAKSSTKSRKSPTQSCEKLQKFTKVAESGRKLQSGKSRTKSHTKSQKLYESRKRCKKVTKSHESRKKKQKSN
jgi:hypothetical protein